MSLMLKTRRLLVVAIAGAGLLAAPFATSAPATTAHHAGYWLLGGDGGVFTFGTRFAGSAGATPSACPANTTDRTLPNGTCWSMAATPSGNGYWILNGDTSTVFNYGDAVHYGQPADAFVGVSREFVPTGVAIVSTPSGHGYWVLESGASGLGTVQAFGDAVSYGDTQSVGVAHDGMPVAMARTHSGHGYWIVDSDGGVFGFGDAKFYGSMGGRHLDAPIVGIASTADSKGYYLAASDGGVFTFGDATFYGSMGGKALDKPVVGIAAYGSTGYYLAASDGGVFCFGGARFLGSRAGKTLDRPVFAIVSQPSGF